MWWQVDPMAESAYDYNPHNSMFNNPISMSDPNGDTPLLGAMALGAGIGAASYTINHLIQNDGSFENWNWGNFAGAVAAGAIGGLVSPVMTAAGIGGFAGGFVTGASSSLAGGFTSGLINGDLNGRDLVISALYGGLSGGVLQGLGAVIDGRNFWDGRRLIQTQILVDQKIPSVIQNGENNCLCASAEAVDGSFGGNLTQKDARKWFPGTSAENDPLLDNSLWEKYGTETGHRVVGLPGSAAGEIVEHMNKGGRVSINLSQQGGVGHSVVIDNVTKSTFMRVNGKTYVVTNYNAMNPSTGNIVRYSSRSITSSNGIWFIF